MIDQASALRSLVRDRIVFARSEARPPKVYAVAVTSGKGGVGKTSIAVNLAIMLSRAGRTVRLIDADFGLSNAEVLLGVTPRHTLEDVVRGSVDINDAWMDCPGGIRLLSSGSGLEAMANIDGSTGVEILNSVIGSVSDGEIIIIDTAPGINDSVISLLSTVDEVMVVTSPEPTSITDTYAAIKVLMSAVPSAEITLISNSCLSPSQAGAVAQGLDGICRRFLNRSFRGYEYVPHDPSVGMAIQCQRPFAIHSTHSPAASWLRRLAIKLAERARNMRPRTATVVSGDGQADSVVSDLRLGQAGTETGHYDTQQAGTETGHYDARQAGTETGPYVERLVVGA